MQNYYKDSSCDKIIRVVVASSAANAVSKSAAYRWDHVVQKYANG